MVFTSSNSSTEGVTPTNVPLPSPGDQTSLDTSSQQDIVNNVQYNVTMIAVNAIGASQPSTPILFTKTPGMYIFFKNVVVLVFMITPQCVYIILCPIASILYRHVTA